MKVCSFNILCYGPVREINGETVDFKWTNRIDRVLTVIRKENPDIFGLQEATPDWMKTLRDALDEYAYVGVGREDGKDKGEYSPVFYKKDKFTLLANDNFWLSETPDVPSKGWDAACYRICSYGVFEEKATGKKFIAMNTHLDHIGVEARKKGGLLIAENADKIGKKYMIDGKILPCVLTGDFNSTFERPGVEEHPDAPCDAYKAVIDGGFADARIQSGSTDESVTYTGFFVEGTHPEIIDFIFTKNGARALSYRVCDELVNGSFPSDHRAIVADIDF